MPRLPEKLIPIDERNTSSLANAVCSHTVYRFGDKFVAIEDNASFLTLCQRHKEESGNTVPMEHIGFIPTGAKYGIPMACEVQGKKISVQRIHTHNPKEKGAYAEPGLPVTSLFLLGDYPTYVGGQIVSSDELFVVEVPVKT